jgi:hypothetical protein
MELCGIRPCLIQILFLVVIEQTRSLIEHTDDNGDDIVVDKHMVDESYIMKHT